MSEYQRYDMNETVQDTIIDRSSDLGFLAGVRDAVSRAEAAARQRDDRQPRTDDLLGQVVAEMPPELRAVTPVHLGRYEFYASPPSVAYAYIAAECFAYFDGQHDLSEYNNALAAYEEAGYANHEDDALILEGAAVAIADDLALVQQ